MSEKVGSGDNGSQLLGQEQVLLDWSELPSYDEMTTPAGATVEKTEEKAEEVRQERMTAQMRGDRLLKAVAESLPGSGPEVAVHENDEEKSDVDTVTMRAEQALGHEQFGTLTNYLLELSYTDEPDEVMKEFRSEAQRISLIDAGDLWEAVSHRAKMERFGENLANIKFYYSMGFDEFAEVLRGGKLVRKDSEGSALKSDLKFSCDHTEAGEWKSGFADERGEKPRDVTMMFDASLLLEDSFMALGKNPSAGVVDWRKSCLGVVTDVDNYVQVRRMLNSYREKELPIYLDDGSWGDVAYSADGLRTAKTAYAEDMRKAQELSEMIFAGGADELIMEHVREAGNAVHTSDLREFYEKYHETESDERREMVEEIVGYYKKVFGVVWPVDIVYRNDRLDFYQMSCYREGGRVKMKINEAWMGEMGVKDTLVGVGHEMCHAYQDTRAEMYAKRMSDNDSDRDEYDRLCYYGRLNYVDADVDIMEYYGQFVEREAYAFEDLVAEKYEQMEMAEKRLSERARRAAKKMGGKIVELKSKSAQSVREGAAQVSRRFARPKSKKDGEHE